MFLLCISVLVIWQGSRRRYLLFGWLWYIGTLVPVIGLVQVGSHSMADRYTYVPLIGLFIIVAWLIHELLRKWQYRRMVFTLLALTAITASMICTWLQAGHWQNSERLFSHAISVTSGNFTAHNNIGIVLAERGDIEQAIEHFTATLKIRQNDIEARFNLAKALDKQGKAEQAIRHYNVVLRLKPGKAEAHSSLGLIFFRQGNLEQAVEAYRRGLRFNPSDVPLHTNLGTALIRQGRIDAAISEFQAALEASPDSETYCNLGLALGFKGLFDEAMKHYNEAIRLWPGNAKAYYLFANILMAQDRVEEAVSKYREALKIDPQHKKARQNLKEALAILNKTDKPAGKRK
jgi:tetratricopeptide (TPR) repeat protein